MLFIKYQTITESFFITNLHRYYKTHTNVNQHDYKCNNSVMAHSTFSSKESNFCKRQSQTLAIFSKFLIIVGYSSFPQGIILDKMRNDKLFRFVPTHQGGTLDFWFIWKSYACITTKNVFRQKTSQMPKKQVINLIIFNYCITAKMWNFIFNDNKLPWWQYKKLQKILLNSFFIPRVVFQLFLFQKCVWQRIKSRRAILGFKLPKIERQRCPVRFTSVKNNSTLYTAHVLKNTYFEIIICAGTPTWCPWRHMTSLYTSQTVWNYRSKATAYSCL